jgi:hypothetical protein
VNLCYLATSALKLVLKLDFLWSWLMWNQAVKIMCKL